MKFTKNGAAIKQIGYGAMTLEGFYGESDDKIGIETLKFAIENDLMIDTADAYGHGHNEELVKQAMAQSSKKAFVATKFGIVFDENETGTMLDTGWGFRLKLNGRPEYIKKCVDDSLKRLGVEQIDLYYAHYLDPDVAVEETVGAMNELVKEGKILHIGLSNVTVEQIKRASSVAHIAAVQYEYSVARREVENEMLQLLNELDSSLVAWSPLANGILTGSVTSIPQGDFRNNNPRYQGENFASNLKIIDEFKAIAKNLHVSPSQLALAWLVNKGENIIPIPGSRKLQRVEENLKALEIKLDASTMEKIDSIAPVGAFKGQTLV